MELLDENSDKIEDIIDINIKLKTHQLAIIKRCIDIEDVNICGLGIMSDKPGAGKTYAILGFIHYSGKKRNIIVVPQNIIKQWCNSIHFYSNGKLKYKKLTEYSDILDLYNNNSTLFDYDILITTSLYYNVIATTMKSNNIKIERVFFDEIDSISQFVVSEISANFCWFVSASFDYNTLGIYTKKIDIELLPYISCKCNDDFIDNAFTLQTPQIYKIICKNIYLDTIFNGIFSQDEYRVLNALDYSKLKKKFCNRIAQNEKEALDFMVKDKLDIIEIETLRIDDINKKLEKYENDNLMYSISMINILKTQLEKAQKSLDESNNKLNLIRERLLNNNCCPLCYSEFEQLQKKVLSPCCKNMICYDCTNKWFNEMKKDNCIYCNKTEVKFEDYIIVKPSDESICILCDKPYENNDNKYYALCCNKNACSLCLKEWYHKLLKESCLYCNKEEVLFEDFKNDKQYEEMRLNEKSGVKYTKKTKNEFIEYFIRTKIYAQCKVIFCSNYIRIFNDMIKTLNKYNIKFIELDDGNEENINISINEYVNGNVNVLLLNSNLFGCGLNLQCTTDILFLHKTETQLEKQIIGRAQRMGRKSKLNVWYIMHENETIIKSKKNNDSEFDIKIGGHINDINNNEIVYNDGFDVEFNDMQFSNFSEL